MGNERENIDICAMATVILAYMYFVSKRLPASEVSAVFCAAQGDSAVFALCRPLADFSPCGSSIEEHPASVGDKITGRAKILDRNVDKQLSAVQGNTGCLLGHRCGLLGRHSAASNMSR